MKKYTVLLAALALLCSGCPRPKGGKKGSQKDAAGREEPVQEPADALAEKNNDFGRSIQPAGDGGYIVSAETSSKGAGLSDIWILKLDSKGEVQWERTFGGEGKEEACSAMQDGEKGYFVAGTTASKDGARKGILVLELDEKGNALWEKTYGEERQGEAHSAAPTADGGHIVAGAAASKSGGGFDAWIIKLDKEGNAEWDRTYGEEGNHAARSIQQTKDGEYLVGGWRQRENNTDSWVMKLGKDGDVEWERTYGEMKYEAALSVRWTEDGVLVAGESQANEEGLGNIWILKLDTKGAITWDRQFGGPLDDRAWDVVEASKEGCVVAGLTTQKAVGGKAERDLDVTDCWVLGLDGKGNVEWDNKFGGSDRDECRSILKTADGGYVLAGSSRSKAKAGSDVWVIKIDGSGQPVWDRTYGD